MKTAHRDLSLLNDSCERALGLVTHINTRMTRNETSFQELVQVVEAHRLHKFRTVHSKVFRDKRGILQMSWSHSLFNENLPLESRTVLASKIGQLTLGPVEIRKPSLPSIGQKSELADFVGERSTVPFTLVGVPLTFLLLPDWSTSSDYEKMKTALRDLSPLNDSCKRALGLVTHINTIYCYMSIECV